MFSTSGTAGSHGCRWQRLDSATGRQSFVSGAIGGVDSGGVSRSERSRASDVYSSGFWFGARHRRRVAAQTGRVAGLPFPLRLSASSGADVPGSVWAGAGAAALIQGDGVSFVFVTVATTNRRVE